MKKENKLKMRIKELEEENKELEEENKKLQELLLIYQKKMLSN